MSKLRFRSFIPKIAHHLAEGNPSSYRYFLERQKETYGELSQDDLNLIFECVEICLDVPDRVGRENLFIEAGVPTTKTNNQ
jgi:hypothetical protein